MNKKRQEELFSKFKDWYKIKNNLDIIEIYGELKKDQNKTQKELYEDLKFIINFLTLKMLMKERKEKNGK